MQPRNHCRKKVTAASELQVQPPYFHGPGWGTRLADPGVHTEGGEVMRSSAPPVHFPLLKPRKPAAYLG